MARDKDSPAVTAYNLAFQMRTREARVARGYTQAELGELLGGVPQTTYKWYETQQDSRITCLPHHLVPKFCIACGVDPTWLFTGTLGRAPSNPLPAAAETTGAPRKRARRGPKAA